MTTFNTKLTKQAHKAAKSAMQAQKADRSGNLLYSDFLGYYMTNPVAVKSSVALPSSEVVIEVMSLLCVFVFVVALVSLTLGLSILASVAFNVVVCAGVKLSSDWYDNTGLFSPKSNTVEAVA
jgi:hypothetical protein